MQPTPHDAHLIHAAQALVRDHITPQAALWEHERRIGHEALAAAAGLGLTRLQVPVAQGGLGMPFGTKARLAEVLAGGDFGFTMSLINTANVAAVLARHAHLPLAAALLPAVMAGQRLGCTALTERGAGSDFAAISTTATRVDGGWRINGHKAWITNAAEADVLVLYAQTEAGSGGRGIAGFLVDGRRAGFQRQPAFALGGQHSIGTGGFVLDGYLARDDELLYPAGQAFKAALGSINGARTYIAAMCCGMVAECLRVASAYGRQRTSFGQPLQQHQGWRWRLAEADADLAACRLMVARAAALVEAGDAARDAAGGGAVANANANANANIGAETQRAAAQAKLLATRMAERHIPALAQAMGAEGLREHHPFSRHLLGARVAGFVDGSTEMLLERISALMDPG